jgi:hypothetical protein
MLRGDAGSGVESLQSCLEQFHAARYELLTTPFKMSLALGLAALDRRSEAMALVDETIGLTEGNGDLIHMPELLRMKGRMLLSQSPANDKDAEQCFRRSLDWSRRQGALAWELRAAIDCAAHLAARGKVAEARLLLLPVMEQFTEDSDTADLRSATGLLATLG